MALQVVAETEEPVEESLMSPELRAAWAKLEASAREPDPAMARPAPERVVVKRAMPDKEILAAMSGLGAVLAVRLMLALAVVGAFALAYLAMSKPTVIAICVLGAYAAATVLPLTYLSTKRT